jgi:hypothetical protein
MCSVRALSASARKSLRTWAKKFSSPNHGALQSQLIRTDSRRAFLVSTPVENSSPALRPPCLCALCVKSPFPATFFIPTFAPEMKQLGQRLHANVRKTSARIEETKFPVMNTCTKELGGYPHVSNLALARRIGRSDSSSGRRA